MNLTTDGRDLANSRRWQPRSAAFRSSNRLQLLLKSCPCASPSLLSAVLEDIEVRLKKATYVYFIGFGFDDRNLQKLGIPDSVKDAHQVRGSTLHWSELEQAPVHRAFGQNKIRLDSSADAIGFLKRVADALYM